MTTQIKIVIKLKLWQHSKTQIVMKLKYSSCDNSKTQIEPKLNLWQNSKLKLWQIFKKKTQIVTKLVNSNCDKCKSQFEKKTFKASFSKNNMTPWKPMRFAFCNSCNVFFLFLVVTKRQTYYIRISLWQKKKKFSTLWGFDYHSFKQKSTFLLCPSKYYSEGTILTKKL